MISESNNNIVILDSNPVHRDNLRSILLQWGYTPISFDREAIFLDNLSLLNPLLVISGNLPLERIFRVINTIQMKYRGLSILVISDDYKIQNLIDTNRFDRAVVVKPSIDPYEIKRMISGIQNTKLKKTKNQKYPLIVGNSPEMVRIKKMISELKDSKDTILIHGEAGTGKDLVARAIHYLSDRNGNPFVKVQVADLSSKWFEYEEKILRKRQNNNKGIIELANTGTIYLERIEKASVCFQSKMLQILDGKSSLIPGSDITNKIDVRIIAAVEKNIGLLVKQNEFRKDLFYRLNVINIKIPPLKNRVEDIPLLTDFFNDMFCDEFGRCYYNVSQKNKDILLRYHWPGNVRELKNVIKNMVLNADRDNILSKFIQHDPNPVSLRFVHNEQDFSATPDISTLKSYLRKLDKISLKDIQKEFIIRTEKKMMKEALVKTKWNRKKASILLGISYKSMLNKIKAYNLT
jgi:two-component system response regulator AtoC